MGTCSVCGNLSTALEFRPWGNRLQLCGTCKRPAVQDTGVRNLTQPLSNPRARSIMTRRTIHRSRNWRRAVA